MSLEKLEARHQAEDAQLLAGRLFREILSETAVPVPIGLESMQALFDEGVARAFGHGLAVSVNTAKGRRTCRVCGCWELEACDGGCWWADEDLCSSCEPEEEMADA